MRVNCNTNGQSISNPSVIMLRSMLLWLWWREWGDEVATWWRFAYHQLWLESYLFSVKPLLQPLWLLNNQLVVTPYNNILYLNLSQGEASRLNSTVTKCHNLILLYLSKITEGSVIYYIHRICMCISFTALSSSVSSRYFQFYYSVSPMGIRFPEPTPTS